MRETGEREIQDTARCAHTSWTTTCFRMALRAISRPVAFLRTCRPQFRAAAGAFMVPTQRAISRPVAFLRTSEPITEGALCLRAVTLGRLVCLGRHTCFGFAVPSS